MKKSQLQTDILSFYRVLLKWANQRPEKASRISMRNYISSQFRLSQNIPKRNFNQIEFLLRQGRNKFTILKVNFNQIMKKDSPIDAIK